MSNSIQEQAEDEIQRLRQALEGQTRRCLELQHQLDRADAGFEEFVSMAAHNLRESLRDVAAFSQLLAETCAGRMDSEASGCLDRIQDGSQKMQSLLADMVDYWSSTAGDRQSCPVDMEAVLCQALLSLDPLLAERGALVTHDPLPRVCGDFATLSRVLCHLVRNAIAYSESPSPRVHISSRQEDPDWVFSVQDNGPGIAPAFQERVFVAFRRLHGKEYPGNGLGLAFCRKAIERHGGRIWLESTSGAGSTFYFTAPAAC
jgi:light-regulated signal transduction histidine kinase (bacteriophytochrome)